jgi:hypothetical protein
MPAYVESRPLEPGVTVYQISAGNPADVQDEINRLMDGVTEGSAEFRHPRREYSIQDGCRLWRSRGYVRRTQEAA